MYFMQGTHPKKACLHTYARSIRCAKRKSTRWGEETKEGREGRGVSEVPEVSCNTIACKQTCLPEPEG